MSVRSLQFSRVLCLISACAAFPAARAEGNLAPADPWTEASVSLFKDSYNRFRAGTGPQAEFGTALTLLMQQPKTAENIDRAERMLSALAEKTPADDLAFAARYYLGRIEQVHRQTPDPAKAREHYRRLIAEAPGSFYADLATVKLAIIDLYEDIPADTRRARFDALLSSAAARQNPLARRDLSLLLADAALQFGYGQAVALDLLIQAEKIGIVRTGERADVMVRIGELARLTGRFDVAREHYRRFLDNYRRDNRRQMVAERLAGLPDPA